MAGIFKAYDIRGIYPEQLDEKIAARIGRAFAVFTGAERVVVGRDIRPHGEFLFKGLVEGLTSQGCDVIDIGLCSTPQSYYANGLLKADGSIMITASHNPAEWNGFKMCRADAVPISGATGIAEIEALVAADDFTDAPVRGRVEKFDIGPAYGEFFRREATFTNKPRIVVDYANAMGSFEISGIADMFDIIPLYQELDGTFPNHEANPLKTETLDAIRAKVRETGADFGAAFDGDADRCGFIDDKGEIIRMDLFTALIAQDILSHGPATILYDLRSSRAVRECIEENGGRAVMSRVGHAFIKAQMREEGACFAGELSGHYYFRENFTAESQGLALVKFTNMLCASGKKASEAVAPLKRYAFSGEINSRVADAGAVFDRIRARYTDGRMYELDGISVEYPEWHFNVRASNTEPLVRLIVEAENEALMTARRDELLALIRA